jgi:S-disulfanyl-L-cysteine oxidoreductase SoxD
LIACSQGNTAPAPAPVQKPIIELPSAADLSALALQLDEGKRVFADNCASCHGDKGQGTDDGPAVIGEHALPAAPPAGSKRDVKFVSAADVYAFVAKNMPGDDPGTLTPQQYTAVVAFALSVNGVKLHKPFDASVAQSIALRVERGAL